MYKNTRYAVTFRCYFKIIVKPKKFAKQASIYKRAKNDDITKQQRELFTESFSTNNRIEWYEK